MDDELLSYGAFYIVLVICLPISAAVLSQELGRGRILDVEPILHATGTRRFPLPILLAIMIATEALIIYRTSPRWTVAVVQNGVVECAQTVVGFSAYFIIGSIISKRLYPEQDVVFDERKHFETLRQSRLRRFVPDTPKPWVCIASRTGRRTDEIPTMQYI